MNSIDIFPWNENFSTGIAEIDEQHKKLVGLLNLLASHLAFNADLPALTVVFDELANYAVYHFQTEEAVWHGYLPEDPLESGHKALHDGFLETVLQLKNEQKNSPEGKVIEAILAFLTRWLASHILENDRYLATVVLALQSGMPLDCAKQYASEQMNGSTRVLIDIILSIYENLSVNTLHLMRELVERRRDGESLRKLSLAVEQSPSSIVITDLNADIEFVNEAFVKATGYSRTEVIGQNPRLLQSGQTPRATYVDMWETLTREEVWKGEFVNKRKDGGEYIESALITPVYQSDGKCTHYLAIKEDITERKQTEMALQESNQLLYSLLNSMAEGAYGVDIDGNCRFVNRSFLRILGYENADEIIGKHIHELIHHSYADGSPYPVIECRMYDAYRRNAAIHVTDEVFWRKDGTAVPVEYWSQPIITDGVMVGAVATFVDISERKKAEEASHMASQYARSLIEASLDPLVTINSQGKITDVNTATEQVTGIDRNDLIGSDFADYFTDPSKARKGYQQVFSQGSVTDYPLAIRHTSGKITDVLYNATVYRDSNGNVLGVFAAARDITERKLAEQQSRIAATVFESQQGMIVTDADNLILQVNKAFTDITGYTAEEVVGKNPRILQSDRQDQDFYAAMWKSINSTGSWDGEVWSQRKNGEIFPEYLTITAVKNQNGIITHYVGTLTDITLRKAAEKEIERLAFYDPLTRLPNRRLLQDRLKLALAASHRNGRKGALLFIDLDNFKALNDTLGHDMGDMLLQQVAERLSACVREGDTVARLGGDEFVVMLEDLSGQVCEAVNQAETIGNKILTVINRPFPLTKQDYFSTSSIGATLFNGHEQSVDELLKHADIAMYQAKTSGRNALCFFDPRMQELISARVSLEDELRKTLGSRQFQLYYQIQVDSEHCPLGAEALVRWTHPERGLVPLKELIPLAEETGLILPIGQWVLDTACAQLKIWRQNPFTRNLMLSVNVSAKQFFQADFVAQVQAAIQRHAVNPMLLKLELTESLLLKNIEDTIATMNALREIGIKFSLDDFGTGYSSLQYLKKLPLDQLKIDQSFVRDIAVDNGDQAIVRTIIAMAASLNLSVIAEGVETEEQRQFLLDNGCTNYQGYLFGKPVPIEQFESLLVNSIAADNNGLLRLLPV